MIDPTQQPAPPPQTPAMLWQAFNCCKEYIYKTGFEFDDACELVASCADWAIPCQPTAFDAGDGWIVHRMADAWHFARPGWRMPKSPPYPTARAAWEALQQHLQQEEQS